MDKELKSMQVLEEERSKLDAFCEQSLKNAMTQERRRYGFVLERQCSLAKHYLAYHSTGHNIYQAHLDDWQEVAKTREFLPESVEAMFATRLRQVSFWSDDDNGNSPRIEDDRISIASQLRKTKSMDASCLDVRAINDISSPSMPHHSLARAKSDFNLTASTHSLVQDTNGSPAPRPKSMAVTDSGTWENPLARALYAYLSSGENQLSFLEGDIIALMGERNKGWQFGENLRTQCSGWFPLAYTEILIDDSATTTSSPTHRRQDSIATTPGGFSIGSPGGSSSAGNHTRNPTTPSNAPAPVTRFGDTLAYRQPQSRAGTDNCSFNAGPPGVPAPVAPSSRRAPPPLPPLPPHPHTLPPPRQPPSKRPPPANSSLHSSNDSGFSNDPPPAPEIDYSDDEAARRTTMMKNHRNKQQKPTEQEEKKENLSTVRGWLGEATNEWYPGHDNKGHRPLRQTSSAGHLATLNRKDLDSPKMENMTMKTVDIPYEKKIKRTKSLWKFRRDNEVLEGMALWKHRSLVDVSALEGTPKPMKKSLSLSKESQESLDVSEETVVNGRKEQNGNSHSIDSEESENDDTESCIVVDDHHKAAKVGSLLPRTRLIPRNGGKRPEPEPRNTDNEMRTRSQRTLEGRVQTTGENHRERWFDPWDNE
uniref:SH3 domain-containing protein n=1 Tax=Clastoptera arizonana TaxID=38151 RepID=A0A1B6C4Q7_9HEMI